MKNMKTCYNSFRSIAMNYNVNFIINGLCVFVYVCLWVFCLFVCFFFVCLCCARSTLDHLFLHLQLNIGLGLHLNIYISIYSYIYMYISLLFISTWLIYINHYIFICLFVNTILLFMSITPIFFTFFDLNDRLFICFFSVYIVCSRKRICKYIYAVFFISFFII